MELGHLPIGKEHPPVIVAEVSANHMGSLERAIQIVEAAAQAGAQAIKLQTYTADTLTVPDKTGSLWNGRELYSLYQEAHTPWEWHAPLFKRAKELGMVPFSTPFDETAVDFLEKLDVPCYKIASLEIVDLPLIERVAKTKKPLILSTGGATLDEITQAVETARAAGCWDLMLLKCTASQPTPPEDVHLNTLTDLAYRFQVPVGISDHTLGVGVPLASIALGACLIEKHLTLAKDDGAIDSPFSVDPAELKLLVTEAKKAWQALGTIHYGPTPSEGNFITLRPSLYFTQDLPAGTLIRPEHLTTLRPAHGLPPAALSSVLGRPLKEDVKKWTPLTGIE